MSDARTVLVVEDVPLLRLEASDLLQEAGFEVVNAPDAAAALAILEQRSDIRVLFTDVDMPPGMDGLDLSREVHRRWPGIELLVTSGKIGLADEDIPDDGKFVPKPYRASTLLAQVRGMIARGHDDG